MGETDRQTDKSSRWAFTAYEAEWPLFQVMNDLVAEWGWQTEICPNTQRKHYQGYLRTKRQVRFAQLKKVFPGVHLETARDWNKLLNYCKKTDTAVPGTVVAEVNRTKNMTMAEAMIMLAEAAIWPSREHLETEDAIKKYLDMVFWEAVASLCAEDVNLIGLFTQPQYHRAFVKLPQLWRNQVQQRIEAGVYDDLVADRQTDRQTEGMYAFDNPELCSRQVMDEFLFETYGIEPDGVQE